MQGIRESEAIGHALRHRFGVPHAIGYADSPDARAGQEKIACRLQLFLDAAQTARVAHLENRIGPFPAIDAREHDLPPQAHDPGELLPANPDERLVAEREEVTAFLTSQEAADEQH